MLVNDVVNVNMEGKSQVISTFDTEKGRLQALETYLVFA